MRPLLAIWILFIAGSLLVKDIRLFLAFKRGELVRVVVDRTENGVITKSHETQIPSAEDAGFLLVWSTIHLGFAALCYGCIFRRRIGFFRQTHVESKDTTVGTVSFPSRPLLSNRVTYWAACAACQIGGLACLGYGSSPPRLAPQMVGFIALIPGSLAPDLGSDPQLLVAVAINLAFWFSARRWNKLSRNGLSSGGQSNVR